jgi:hypothetical protein
MGNRSVRRLTAVAAVVALVLLVSPAVADAVTRYAAPGGTAADTVCISPNAPKCSIGAAAGGPDVLPADEAVILPGTYFETAGDLGGDSGTLPATVEATAGNVHGAPGAARPVIVLDSTAASPNNNFFGAFFVGGTLSDVEIDTGPGSTAFDALSQTGSSSLVDRVIVRSNVPNGFACNQAQGTIRDSACLSTGSGGIALGASTFIGGTFTVNVRNVTAVSTGSGSYGLNYFYGTSSPPVGPTITISAKGVIAQGVTQDVLVKSTGQGSTVTMNLDHSDFDTSGVQQISNGVASVTAPGTGGPNFNITDGPLLAADGFHELAGSPTINVGATDGNSGTQDIDGQDRSIHGSDIGADELGDPVMAAVTCSPTSVAVGSTTTCTATVTDSQAVPSTPLGTVGFSADTAGGSFGSGGACTLMQVVLGQSSCQVTYSPGAVGSGTHILTGAYSGDTKHDPSQGSSPLTVTSLPTAGQGPGTGPGATQGTGTKKCKKHKHHAVAAKKCKKKRR